MGTRKMQHRRNRRGRARGFAPFVAFALLFAFALGQGSSLVAFAFDNSGATPTVSKDGSAPASDDSGNGGGAADDGAAKVSGSGPAATSSDSGSTSTRKVGTARERTGAGGILSHGGLHGGDVNLDFVAAGPFTYNHNTGLGAYPDFGYNDRTISKTEGVVESLEGGDFACDDLVTFFVQVAIEDDAAGSGTVQLDLSFGAETTGQPGLGFDEIVSFGINTPDDGNVGNVGDNVVTLAPPGGAIETAGYDELKGTFTITNLAPGETAILRVTVHLACEVGGSPTGNILNAIESARADGQRVPVGEETVPMKQVGGIAAAPAISVIKDCPTESPFGDEITYEITVSNEGNEALVNLSVTDTLLGDITDEFPNTTLEVGEINTVTVEYTPKASDPDPLTNTVTAEADGDISDTHVTDTADCVTDITHEPGIDVKKSCPAEVAAGADIEYTITVENTGNEALTGVKVTDTLLGDITGEFNFNFANPFPAGATATATVTYEQQAGDPDPITNTVTAEGTGADSGAKATDTASCITDITHVPGIAVTKTCPAQAGEGDTVTYTITVSNTGNEALEDVTVMDSVLGDLSDSFGDTLAVGASETQEFDFTVPEDGADPLVNVVTVSGTGADSGTTVDSTATCSTDILHPGIAIVKTVSDDTVAVGDTVTYTYVVTNTGDTTLFEITVDDDVLGHIGDIAVLEPGESATLTADFVVGDEPVINVAIARGHDILGRVVEASDDALVTPIAPTVVTTPPPPTTPFTGSDAGRLGLIAALALGIGLTVVAATRRRRSGETT